MDDDDFSEAMAVGTGYALYRHGQDRLAAQISGAVRAALDDWEPAIGDEPAAVGLGREAELPARRTWSGVVSFESGRTSSARSRSRSISRHGSPQPRCVEDACRTWC